MKQTSTKPLTKEMVEEIIKDVFDNNRKRPKGRFDFFPPIGKINSIREIYHIGQGVMTGKEGWILFNELLHRKANDISTTATNSSMDS